MNKSIKGFFSIPVSYFSIVLGLFSFGFTLRHAAQLHPSFLFTNFANGTLLFGVALWLIFLLTYLIKWLYFFQEAKSELTHPLLCCFISLIPITTILSGLTLRSFCLVLPPILIIIGIITQMIFAVYRTAHLWQGTHKAEATTPVIYLPTVAANFVSAVALLEVGYPAWGWLFFGMAVFSWATLEPAILQRLRNLTPLDGNLKPILGIQLAPAFVGVNTYLHFTSGHFDAIALMLLGYGLLQLLLLLKLLPWIAQKGFVLGLWSFSFGLGSMANAGLYLTQNKLQGLESTGFPLFWLGVLAFIGLIFGTIIHVMQRIFSTQQNSMPKP